MRPPRALLLVSLAPLLSPALSAAAQDAARTSTEGRLEPETVVLERLVDARHSPFLPPGRAAATERGAALPPSGSFLTVNQDPEGDMPRELAYSADGSEVVIVNRDTDLVSFLDVATRTISNTVAVGDFPVHVAVTPDNAWAVVPNVFDDTVSVIDMAGHTLAATVPVTGTQPYRVAVTSDSAFAVVGVINDAVSSSISVIDLGSMSEVLSFGTTPQGVFGGFFSPEAGIFGNIFTSFALSPDDVTLLLPDRFNDQLALYDITSGAQVALLATSEQPTTVDVSADGTLAVLADDGNGASVEVVDLTIPAITNSFVTGSQTFVPLIRVTPDKSHAILSVLNNVEFVNLTTGAVSSTVSTGSVGDIEISFDGQYALVPNFNFRIIDIASQSLVKTIPFASCYDAAASPVEHRCVALNNRFREDAQVYATNGAAGAFEGAALSGPPEEGDAPRSLALTPDGARALVADNTSDNAVLVDLATASVLGYLPTGNRSLGIEVADAATAVVANGGEDRLSVLDLNTLAEVASLAVPSTPAEVEVAPDGSEAYVTSLAGTDRLWFVDLAGAASAVTGSLVTGQMGSIGYSYGVFSGLTLSPDGTTLAVCISFDDQLMVVDAATQTEVARVTVGDFPIRAAFSPDSKEIYVTHSFGDSVHRVTDMGGGNWVANGSTGNIEFPLQITVDAAGEYAYVGSFDLSDPHVRVVRLSDMTKVAKVPLTSRPRSHAVSGDALFVSLTDGDVARLRMAGPATTLVESAPLSGSPSDMRFSAALGTAVACQPGVDDGLDLVRFGGDATNYCGPAVPNSSGNPGVIAATGTFLAGGLPLTLTASDLPQNQFGYFLAGMTQGFVANPGGSQGNLCLGGVIGRFAAQVKSSGAAGVIAIEVDTTAIPMGPPVAIQPGETWNFQCWFRDQNPGNTSNFSDGTSVLFD